VLPERGNYPGRGAEVSPFKSGELFGYMPA
jgi:hypothetical protein